MTAAAASAGEASHRVHKTHPPRGWLAKTSQLIGELLLTFGLVVFLFIFYELKVTDWIAAGTQHHLAQSLEREWKMPVLTPPAAPATKTKHRAIPDPALTVAEGDAFAIIRIPRFGADYSRVVVQGVDESDLQKGPGHYPGTAWPGQIGNMVLSGHRTTYGHSFNQLDELNNGDAVNLQVRNVVYTYKVISKQIVDPTDVAVILPVPNKFGATPTQRLLTMTTCNPKYSATQRLVVTAELSGVTG